MTMRLTACHGLFVTGTDTGVGKTYVTSMIARQLLTEAIRVGVHKPVACGSDPGAGGQAVWHDVEELTAAVDGSFEKSRICPQRFSAPLAPPVAARREGCEVDARQLRDGIRWWDGRVDVLLIEGVGGLLCPLTDDETVADLAREVGYPLVIVARLGLGTINHTLLTIEAARIRGLRIAGIVLNQSRPDESGAAAETNPAEIAARCEVPILGIVAHNQSDGLLREGRAIRINWLALAEGERL